MHHAQADSTPPITESVISLSASYNDPGNYQTTLKNPINVAFHHDDFMYKHKFHLVLDVFKLRDSDDENVCDLNANECRKDGLKSKSTRMSASERARGSSATC